MIARPKLKIAATRSDLILDVLCWVAMIGSLVFSLLIFPKLPETIPTHFGINGVANGFGNKMMIFFPVSISLALFLIVTLLGRFPHIFNYPVEITEQNALTQYTMATRFVRVLKFIIVAIFTSVGILISLTALKKIENIGFWFVPIVLIVVLTPISFYIVKARKSQ